MPKTEALLINSSKNPILKINFYNFTHSLYIIRLSSKHHIEFHAIINMAYTLAEQRTVEGEEL